MIRSLLLALVLAATLPAQWIKYPTPGVPRTADGKPNLTAPAPHTADGKPDLSGIWGWEDNRPCPPDGCADQKVGQEFINIGWSIKEGLPFQPWAAELKKTRAASNNKDDPQTRCLPRGAVRVLTDGLYKKIVQVPGLLLMLSERNASYRQIFTDGRPLPEDPNPSLERILVGQVERDTLVIQTTGILDGSWLDASGTPLTESAKMTERFRRVNFGTLEVGITMDDPKAYTRPWSITLHQPIVVDTELLDYICLENEKDVTHLVGR